MDNNESCIMFNEIVDIVMNVSLKSFSRLHYFKVIDVETRAVELLKHHFNLDDDYETFEEIYTLHWKKLTNDKKIKTRQQFYKM